MRPARAKVVGRFDMASVLQEATVTIEREVGLFSVRPKRRRKIYTLPLAKVAEMVVHHVIRVELIEKKRAKVAARKARR